MIRQYYDDFNNDYFWDVIYNGVTIYTSGSSGQPKEVFQPAHKIVNDAKNACAIQGIDESSVIYTCLSPLRAGGLFVQTIPGLIAGATIDLVKFNPYDYVRAVHKYTHSHLTPKQANAVTLTKGFKTLDLTGHVFLIGSEPVTYDIITAFVERGAKVILIWGMTEIGPNAIMHVFNDMKDVNALKDITPQNSTPLGNIIICEVSVINSELHVRGENCVYDNWFNTKDTVIEKDGYLFYTGRSNTVVDFNKPRKG